MVISKTPAPAAPGSNSAEFASRTVRAGWSSNRPVSSPVPCRPSMQRLSRGEALVRNRLPRKPSPSANSGNECSRAAAEYSGAGGSASGSGVGSGSGSGSGSAGAGGSSLSVRSNVSVPSLRPLNLPESPIYATTPRGLVAGLDSDQPPPSSVPASQA